MFRFLKVLTKRLHSLAQLHYLGVRYPVIAFFNGPNVVPHEMIDPLTNFGHLKEVLLCPPVPKGMDKERWQAPVGNDSIDIRDERCRGFAFTTVKGDGVDIV